MDLEQIKPIIGRLHAGASYVVVYKKKAVTITGEEVCKITSKPCRLGVRYGHLKQMKGLHPQSLPGNGKWVIDKYVYEDTNGYKLRITNGAFGKATSIYTDSSGRRVDASLIRHTDAKHHAPIVQCIKLENVIAIKKKGEDV